MAGRITFEDLRQAVKGSTAAIRCRAKLQPAGGPGTKVFPPTYSGAVYAKERRRLPDRSEPVDCVLLDSVQSQANRMEEALQQAVDDGRLKLPVIEVDFTPFFPGDDQAEGMKLLEPLGKVSSLQAPHRIADAILRDSLFDGKKFRESEIGKAIDSVSLRNATPLFELCPTALLFGMWDSTGPKGGLGAKFERAIVSEIVGIDAVYGVKTSSRIDPLGIQKIPDKLYAAKDGGWTLDESKAKQDTKGPKRLGKEGKPSEANHGNVTPSLSDRDSETSEPLAGGVTITYAEQTLVISLPALRRLRFPIRQKADPEVEVAARTVLAALGLVAASLADEAGLDLRSRCLLYTEEDLTWEFLDRREKRSFTLTADNTIELFHEAVEAAKKLGLPWREEPLTLRPMDDLVKLVANSQRLAASEGGVDGEGGE